MHPWHRIQPPKQRREAIKQYRRNRPRLQRGQTCEICTEGTTNAKNIFACAFWNPQVGQCQWKHGGPGLNPSTSSKLCSCHRNPLEHVLFTQIMTLMTDTFPFFCDSQKAFTVFAPNPKKRQDIQQSRYIVMQHLFLSFSFSFFLSFFLLSFFLSFFLSSSFFSFFFVSLFFSFFVSLFSLSLSLSSFFLSFFLWMGALQLGENV